ncbi:unnamed protein product, partial [marine sediment metagenome]
MAKTNYTIKSLVRRTIFKPTPTPIPSRYPVTTRRIIPVIEGTGKEKKYIYHRIGAGAKPKVITTTRWEKVKQPKPQLTLFGKILTRPIVKPYSPIKRRRKIIVQKPKKKLPISKAKVLKKLVRSSPRARKQRTQLKKITGKLVRKSPKAIQQ